MSGGYLCDHICQPPAARLKVQAEASLRVLGGPAEMVGKLIRVQLRSDGRLYFPDQRCHALRIERGEAKRATLYLPGLAQQIVVSEAKLAEVAGGWDDDE